MARREAAGAMSPVVRCRPRSRSRETPTSAEGRHELLQYPGHGGLGIRCGSGRIAQPVMEKRVLLAILLCFVSLYLWQALVVKPVPKPATPPTPAPAASSATTPGNSTGSLPPEAPPASVPAAASLPAAVTSEAA